jgi:hypothetical protein
MLDLNTLLSPTDPLNAQITLTYGLGVNDNGQIVADGCYNSGSSCDAFLLTPAAISNTPEPASLAILRSDLLGAAALRRRRAR